MLFQPLSDQTCMVYLQVINNQEDLALGVVNQGRHEVNEPLGVDRTIVKLKSSKMVSADGQPHGFADSAQHFHQSVDSEFGGFLVHDIGNARARHLQDLCGVGLF